MQRTTTTPVTPDAAKKSITKTGKAITCGGPHVFISERKKKRKQFSEENDDKEKK